MAQSLVDLYPENVEYFHSPTEILEQDDLVEMDIRILGWEKKFRIRALTFAKMLKINANATNKEGNLDDKLFVLWTIVEGVIRPNFTIDQAERLLDKNGESVKELSDQIWNIGRMNKKVFDTYIAELKRANEEHQKDLDLQKTKPNTNKSKTRAR